MERLEKALDLVTTEIMVRKNNRQLRGSGTMILFLTLVANTIQHVLDYTKEEENVP